MIGSCQSLLLLLTYTLLFCNHLQVLVQDVAKVLVSGIICRLELAHVHVVLVLKDENLLDRWTIEFSGIV